MKKFKITYYVATGLLTAMMLMSAGMYLFTYDDVAGLFESFGFPTFIIYPLAIAKILGIVAIWFFDGKPLKEWAYAGFLFDFLLAFGAHANIDDSVSGPIMAMVLLIVSYVTYRKLQSAQ